MASGVGVRARSGGLIGGDGESGCSAAGASSRRIARAQQTCSLWLLVMVPVKGISDKIGLKIVQCRVPPALIQDISTGIADFVTIRRVVSFLFCCFVCFLFFLLSQNWRFYPSIVHFSWNKWALFIRRLCSHGQKKSRFVFSIF